MAWKQQRKYNIEKYPSRARASPHLQASRSSPDYGRKKIFIDRSGTRLAARVRPRLATCLIECLEASPAGKPAAREARSSLAPPPCR